MTKQKFILPAFICIIAGTPVAAQPSSVTQAIVHTTTNIIAPEDEDVSAINPQGQGGMNFRNFGDGETKSVTYLKGGMVKTVLKSETFRSTIYRNNDTRTTTTIFEIMGDKRGFYITDEEQAAMMKQRDSMMQARRRNDSSQRDASITINNNDQPIEIIPTEEKKKIAGYVCTKAWMVTTRLLGIKDSVVLWYTPELKIQNLFSTGGTSGFGNMVNPVGRGFEKVDGFVMGYEMNMRRNRKMEVYVTKIELNKEIADKEFDLPKDIDIKPMKEMQSMFGGGQGNFQFRRNP